MNKYYLLKELVASVQEDAEKFFQQENKAAGTRLRKRMLDARILAQEIREEISTLKKKKEQD